MRSLHTIIDVARIFSGVHFLLDQKSDDLFVVITLSYMVIYVINCHQLPSGGAPHHIQPHFCLIPTKKSRKKLFFVTLEVNLHPMNPNPPLHTVGFDFDA